MMYARLYGMGVFHEDRRRKRGCCLACGYDLRGNGSGRCPECGNVNPGQDSRGTAEARSEAGSEI